MRLQLSPPQVKVLQRPFLCGEGRMGFNMFICEISNAQQFMSVDEFTSYIRQLHHVISASSAQGTDLARAVGEIVATANDLDVMEPPARPPNPHARTMR